MIRLDLRVSLGENQSMGEFNPQCISGQETFAISNRDVLLPCCYVDNAGEVEGQALKDLIMVSTIDDHDSIDDIVIQKEWVAFYNLLIEAKDKQDTSFLPHVCKSACSNKTVRQEDWQE